MSERFSPKTPCAPVVDASSAGRPAPSVTSAETGAARLRELWTMPFAFLGFALWRAWVSLSYAAPVFQLAAQSPGGGKLLYDICLVATSVTLAFCARRLVPLNGRRWCYVACFVAMTASAVLYAVALRVPEWAPVLVVARDVLAGAGSAVMILLWCEVYACLTPTRAAVYLSLTMMLGVVLTFVLQGLTDAWLQGALVVLPGLSLVLSYRSYSLYVDASDRPHAGGERPVPWRLLALLALYGVLEGLCTGRLGAAYAQLIGPHSTLATFLAALALFVCVLFCADRFDFSLLYRTPAVLAVCGLLLLPLLGMGGTLVGALCVSVSSSLFGMAVLLLLCDASRRTGVAAVWLFGLEETSVMFQHAGSWLATAPSGAGGVAQTAVTLVGVVLVVAFTALLLAGWGPGGRKAGRVDGRADGRVDGWAGWGSSLLGLGGEGPRSEQARTDAACETLARERALSPREVEVLKLLVQGKSIAQVAAELLVAEGTAKAHTQHIYEKVGVARRQDLLDAVLARTR